MLHRSPLAPQSFQDVAIHIYITRFDASNLDSMELLETQVSAQDPALPIPQTFSIRQLWAHMTRPTVSSSAQAEVMQDKAGAANRLGDIFVWNGRPQWEQVFEYVRDRRPQDLKHIGCTFCGACACAGERCSAYCAAMGHWRGPHPRPATCRRSRHWQGAQAHVPPVQLGG